MITRIVLISIVLALLLSVVGIPANSAQAQDATYQNMTLQYVTLLDKPGGAPNGEYLPAGFPIERIYEVNGNWAWIEMPGMTNYGFSTGEGWMPLSQIGGPIPEDTRITQSKRAQYRFDTDFVTMYRDSSGSDASIILESEAKLANTSQWVTAWDVDAEHNTVLITTWVSTHKLTNEWESLYQAVWVDAYVLDLMSDGISPIVGSGAVCAQPVEVGIYAEHDDLDCGLPRIERTLLPGNPAIAVIDPNSFVPFPGLPSHESTEVRATQNITIYDDNGAQITTANDSTPMVVWASWKFGPAGVMAYVTSYPTTQTIVEHRMLLGFGYFEGTYGWALAANLQETNCTIVGGSNIKSELNQRTNTWYTVYNPYKPYPEEAACPQQ